jgi:site-specific DNA recombinase
MTKGNAVVYARVSTEEQARERNAANIPTQVSICKGFCDSNALHIVKQFIDDGHSARTTERPAFQQMLTYLREQRGKVQHVVIQDLSRLARNSTDQGVVLTRLSALSISLHSVYEPHIGNTAAGKLSSGLLGVINQYQSDVQSERIKERMAAAARAGRFVNRPPLGYKMERKNGLKNVAPDEKAPLISKAFELMASGSFSLFAVLRSINALGLTTAGGKPLSKQSLSVILHNPIYKGVVKIGAVEAIGTFEPLTDVETWQKANNTMKGRRASAPKKSDNPDFVLRGSVRCAGCGKPITAGWATGQSKKKYARYWCWTKGCGAVSVSRAELEDHFITLLGMLEPTQELLKQLPGKLRESSWQQRQERIKTERAVLERKKSDEDTLNSKAVEALLNGRLTDADFTAWKAKSVITVQRIEDQIKALESEHFSVEELARSGPSGVVPIAMIWQNVDGNTKKEIQRALWPDGIWYSPELRFFEPHNLTLMQAVKEFLTGLTFPASPVQDGCGGQI